jgi:quinol monooxygenase YgiN
VLADALRQSGAFDREEADLGESIFAGANGRSVTGAPSPSALQRRVKASQDVRALRSADLGSAALQAVLQPQRERKGTQRADVVNHVGTRTFYRVSERWIDADYDQDAETNKVESFSDEYFKLIRKHPELARCFALGQRVVVVIAGTAYETIPAQEE